MNNSDTKLYPINPVPRRMRDAIFELHYECGVPIELVAPLVLGVASIACQGSVDVERPNCAPSSCSLNIGLIAGSGDRKSTILNKLMRPVHAFEDDFAAQATARFVDYEAEQLIWEEEQKAIMRQIARSAKKGESSDDFKARLVEHIAGRPAAPKFLKLIYEDPTPEAVLDGIFTNWPSVAVVSAEAGGFFNGRPMYDMPLWNKIWDGTGVGIERVVRGSASHKSPRGTLLLAIQEGQFKKFYASHGAAAMDIGFLARFLIAAPASIAGERFLQLHKPKSTWNELTKFQDRVGELLNNEAKKHFSGATDRAVLKFSQEAEHHWIESHNKIEALLAPGAQLSHIPGFASKLSENIARVAAIFHFFEGAEGDISYDSMYAAVGVCEWHTYEFMRLFPAVSHKSIEQSDAEVLEKWLYASVWQEGQMEIQKNRIRQSGPPALRNIARLNNALRLLMQEGKIFMRFGFKNTNFVILNSIRFLAKPYSYGKS